MTDKKIELDALDRAEALKYMGQRDANIAPVLSEIMERCEQMVLREAVPRYLYRVVDIEAMEQGIAIEGADFLLEGEDIKNHLQGCKKAIIMCATLSAGIDRLIRLAQKRDMAEAMAVDALASTAIEQVCEKVGELLQEKFPQYHHTWRYGIGYGDFPIEQQPQILQMLDASKKIGLNTTASHMLTPGKSVTAVIGLSEEKVQNKGIGCDRCRLQGNCQFRKEGKYCDD